MNPYNPDPATYWWEHLSSAQRRFLADNWGRNYSINEWYELVNSTNPHLRIDLHSLKGINGESWPETTVEDLNGPRKS